MIAALDAVHARIAHAARRASRDPASVRLVAVTKNVDVASINAVIQAGVTDIGENRVQDAESKRTAVTGDAAWHLIGHLQTNKARRAAELFDAVHSVDSERIARALATHRHLERDPLAVLIEVELTGMAARSGVMPDGLDDLARAVVGLPAIHLVGLMTIAPPTPDPETARPYFARLRALRDEVEQICAWPLPELSMGMSDDLEVAVEEGATIIRVGRAIFGPRS